MNSFLAATMHLHSQSIPSHLIVISFAHLTTCAQKRRSVRCYSHWMHLKQMVRMAYQLGCSANAIAPSITNQFNHSITCARPPSSWKMPTDVPIPKKQRANCTSEFRPISLLSILSKVLVYSLISEHISIYRLLANSQWGFQKGKSTVSALLRVTRVVPTPRKHNRRWCSVFWFQEGIWHGPPYALGVQTWGTQLGSSCSCLDQQLPCKQTPKGSSKWSNVGVNTCNIRSPPRLSIGLPSFSNLYWYDIVKVTLSEGNKLVLYADDILLYCPIHTNENYSVWHWHD